MKLFLHLLKNQKSVTNHVHDLGLISLRKNSKFFETYSDSVKHFKDHFFLVIPFNKEAHTKIFKLELGSPLMCTHLFCKF